MYSKVIYFAAEGAVAVAGALLHLCSMVLVAAEVVDVLQGLYSMALAVAVAAVIGAVVVVLCPKVTDVVVAVVAVVVALSESTETVAAGRSADLDNVLRAVDMTAAVAGDAGKSGVVVAAVVVENHAAETGSVEAGLDGTVVGIAADAEGAPVLGVEFLVSLPVLAAMQVLVWMMQQQL